MDSFRILIFVTFFKIGTCESTVWQYTTACYGSDPKCSDYQIQCGTGSRIVIGSLKYGGKKGSLRCQLGISNCDEVLTLRNTTVDQWCCRYNKGDYLADFNPENRTSVVNNCNGRRKCSGSVPRILKTAYSSYAWIQYACVNDDSSIELCKKGNTSGLDMLITFNHSQTNTFLREPHDCTCRVHSLDCNTNLELTVLDFNLNSTGSQAVSGCPNTHLELTPSQIIRCDSPANGSTITYIRDWRNTLALRHLFWNGSTDRPGSVIIQVKAVQTRSPIAIECFEPGIVPNNDINCPSSTSSTSSLHTTVSISPRQSVTTQYHRTTTLMELSSQSNSYPHTLQTSSPAGHTPTVISTQTYSTRTVSDDQTTVSSESTDMLNNKLTTDSVDIVTGKTTHVASTTSDTGNEEHLTTPSNELTSSASFSSAGLHQSTATSTKQLHTKSPQTVSSVSTLPTDTPTTESDAVNQSNHSVTQESITTYASGSNESDIPAEVSVTTKVFVEHSTTSTITAPKDNVNTDNKTLIIGLTIGAVVFILIAVAIIACCCYTRLKRKEKVERNYVRNTNIFYSFPEEYIVTENMSYEPMDMADPNQQLTSVIDLTGPTYDTVRNQTPSSTIHHNSKSLPINDYNIKRQQANGVNPNVSDRVYQTDVANGTVEFINGTEPDITSSCPDDVDNVITHGTLGRERSVSFDPLSLYSQVRKDGKTKF